MTTSQIIVAAVLFAVAVVLAIFGIRQLRCKGFCFNNAYIYASKEEREKTDFTPYYKQSGVVLLLLSGVFAVNCIHVISKLSVLFYVSMALTAAAVIFAVVSSVRTGKKNK